jgi:hypothetical protein
MGKNRSKKRRRATEASQALPGVLSAKLLAKHDAKQQQPQPSQLADDSDSETSVHSNADVPPRELGVTIRTLQRVSADQLATKPCRELRTALFPLLQALHTRFDPIDYPARVTTAVARRHWSDALFALQAVAHFGTLPSGEAVKRGTIQRWVRACDDCPNVPLRLKVLRAILACTPEEGNRDTPMEDLNQHDPLRVLQGWREAPDDEDTGNTEDKDDIDGDTQNNDYSALVTKRSTWIPPPHEVATLATEDDTEDLPPPVTTVLHHIVATDRKPPNHYDLKICGTPATALLLDSNENISRPVVQKHDISTIPGAFVLQAVLSPAECRRLVHTAEHMGFVPDHPVTAAAPTGIDTCEWLADEALLKPLEARVRTSLPATLHGEAVAGVNARWRLFRYGPDAVYRPHIDGSWPASVWDGTTVHTDDARKSRLTFLIYLNDDFTGGETTFYLPSSGNALEAVAVQPQQGNILCFPQGNTASLVHEGSRVTQGFKYVIRTDVLYHSKRATTAAVSR